MCAKKNGILILAPILLITVGAFALFIRESILHSRTPAASRGLWLEVKPEKPTYIVGEPVVLNLIIHNDGDEKKVVEMVTHTEDYVSVTLESDGKDSFEKVGRVALGFSIGSHDWQRHEIVPKQSLTLPILLSEWHRIDKSGEFSGTLDFNTAHVWLEDSGDIELILSAKFKIRTVAGSLDDAAAEIYDAWLKALDAENSWDMETYMRRLAHMHGDAAVPYLKKIILDKRGYTAYGTPNDACDGLARIESVASTTELVALAEDEELPKMLSDHCNALAGKLYKNSKKDEIREIVKTVAGKYPNPEN